MSQNPPTRTLPLSRIRPPSDALRVEIDPERIAALADDIAAHGLLQPIGVRGPDGAEFYEVVWGHRRYLAHLLLQRPEIEARVFAWDYDPLAAMAAENLGQEPMTPIEEALLCQRYIERGMPIAGIARLTRRSDGWVTQRLALLGMPHDVQERVQGKRLSLVVAEVLAQIDHDEYRAHLLDEAERTGATAAVARVWAAHYAADRERIVSNHMKVAEIAAQRESFVLYVRCEIGQHEVPVTQTRALRGCLPCMDELAKAIALSQTATG